MGKIFARIGAVVIALLFLVTSLSFSILVIWQSHHKTNSSNSAQDNTKGNQLQGTQLTNFTPTDKVPTLQAIDLKPGSGAQVKPGDTVTVHYTGAVAATGIIFQSSLDTGQPVSFGLNQVIKGWADGIPGMKVGGTRRLLIPANLAYGATPPPGSGIPADAALVFDVQLIKIGQ